jgi:hypothetical protein
MKQQSNSFPSKVNSTTKNLNKSKEEEMLNIEFQKIIGMIIKELKEETHMLVSELKQDMNKQFKKLKENSNKQMNELKKTMQHIKKEIHKDTEIQKNNQFEIKSSILQRKTSINSLSNRGAS